MKKWEKLKSQLVHNRVLGACYLDNLKSTHAHATSTRVKETQMPAPNKMFHGLFEDDAVPVRKSTVPLTSSPLARRDASEVLRAWAASDPIQCAMERGLSWGEACDIGNDAYYEALGVKYLARQRALDDETAGWAAAGGGGGSAAAAAAAATPPAASARTELEECRYFNTPRGCREGDDCDYLHIKRSLSDLRCRFLDTPRGCNPGFGRRCPYKH